MVFCILVPVLLSVIYSYNIDYQPQGRYLMPVLIPFCYYCVRGLEKGIYMLFALLRHIPALNRKKEPVNSALSGCLLTGLCVFLILLILSSACITIYGYAFPYYAGLQGI